MIKNISNLGDAALYCNFGEEVNKETNSNVIKYFKNVNAIAERYALSQDKFKNFGLKRQKVS